MRFSNTTALSFVVLFLSACAGNPYAPGKTLVDVPAHIDTIRLQSVEVMEGSENFKSEHTPAVEPSPSSTALEVLSLVKRSVINQLTNYGYKIVEGETEKADVTFKVFSDYTPEYVFLVHRQMRVGIYVSNPADELLFWKGAGDYNKNGILTAAIQSRDDMVAAVSSNAVVNTVNELQKSMGGEESAQKVVIHAPTGERK